MITCKKCGDLMMPSDSGFRCVGCGFESKGKDLVESEKTKKKKEVGKGVVSDKNIFADYPFVCEKCGYKKAEVVERQPYVSDEDSLTYLKCGKCGWMENLAKKIG